MKHDTSTRWNVFELYFHYQRNDVYARTLPIWNYYRESEKRRKKNTYRPNTWSIIMDLTRSLITKHISIKSKRERGPNSSISADAINIFLHISNELKWENYPVVHLSSIDFMAYQRSNMHVFITNSNISHNQRRKGQK